MAVDQARRDQRAAEVVLGVAASAPAGRSASAPTQAQRVAFDQQRAALDRAPAVAAGQGGEARVAPERVVMRRAPRASAASHQPTGASRRPSRLEASALPARCANQSQACRPACRCRRRRRRGSGRRRARSRPHAARRRRPGRRRRRPSHRSAGTPRSIRLRSRVGPSSSRQSARARAVEAQAARRRRVRRCSLPPMRQLDAGALEHREPALDAGEGRERAVALDLGDADRAPASRRRRARPAARA